MYTTLITNHKSYIYLTIKIPKLNRWSMELADYNIMFIHIKGKYNIESIKYLQRTVGEPPDTSS